MEWLAEVAVQDSFELADTSPDNLIAQRLQACKSWQDARADYFAAKRSGALDAPRSRDQLEVLESIEARLETLIQAVAGRAADGDTATEPLRAVTPRPPVAVGVPSRGAAPGGSAVGASQATAAPASTGGKASMNWRVQDYPELAHWLPGEMPWPKMGMLLSMKQVYEVYYLGDPSAKKPALQDMENKYGPKWRTPWKKRWNELKQLFEAIDDAAAIRKKGTKEAAEFWASKQGKLTVDQQRGFIQQLRAGTAKDDDGHKVTFDEYVSNQRPADFVSPVKAKVRRPKLYSDPESPLARAVDWQQTPRGGGGGGAAPYAAAALAAAAQMGGGLAPGGEASSPAAAGGVGVAVPMLAARQELWQLHSTRGSSQAGSSSTAAALAVNGHLLSGLQGSIVEGHAAAAALAGDLCSGASPLAAASGAPTLVAAGQVGGVGKLLQGHSMPSPGAAAAAGAAGANEQRKLAADLQQLQQLMIGNPTLAALVLNGGPLLAALLPSRAVPSGSRSGPTQQTALTHSRASPAAAAAAAAAQTAAPSATALAVAAQVGGAAAVLLTGMGSQLPALQDPAGSRPGAAALGGPPPPAADRAAATSASAGAGAAASGSATATGGRGKKRKLGGLEAQAEPDVQPKRQSGYTLFISERKAEIKVAKAAGTAEVMTSRDETAALAAEWRQLGERKATYNKRAAIMNAEAKGAMQ